MAVECAPAHLSSSRCGMGQAASSVQEQAVGMFRASMPRLAAPCVVWVLAAAVHCNVAGCSCRKNSLRGLYQQMFWVC